MCRRRAKNSRSPTLRRPRGRHVRGWQFLPGRDLLVASAAVTGSALTAQFRRRKYSRDLRPSRSRVAVLPADQYSDSLEQLIYDGIRPFNLNVRGKSVLLKPNLVEYILGRPVNTDTQLIGGAAETFLRLGAASVTVAEDPGHYRDTDLHIICSLMMPSQPTRF